MKYYKKKYLIGIYSPISEGETLLALVDNISQFAELMNISYQLANVVLSRIFHKQHNCIRFNRKLCTVQFIDMED